MRKSLVLAILIVSLLLSGCVTTQLTKTVQVTKDKSGNIIEYKTTESAIQVKHANPLKFEYLKGVADD